MWSPYCWDAGRPRTGQRNVPTALVVALVWLVSTAGFSQDQDRCDAVLIANVTRYQNNRTLSSNATDDLCDIHSGSTQHERANHYKAAAVIKGVPAEAGGDLTGKDAADWWNKLCTSKTLALSEDEAQSLVMQYVPEANVNAWLQCENLRALRGPQAIALTDALEEPYVTITAKAAQIRGAPPASVEQFYFDGADCKHPFERGRTFDSGGISTTCARIGTGPMVFVLNAKGYGTSPPLQIAGLPQVSAVKPPPTPVPPCQNLDSQGNCTLCTFDDATFKMPSGGTLPRVCTGMKHKATYTVTYTGSIVAGDGSSPSTSVVHCLLQSMQNTVKLDHSKTAGWNTSYTNLSLGGTTDNAGNATATIAAESCSIADQPAKCESTGPGHIAITVP